MSLQDRLETLRTRHANLETEIVKEISRPLPNPETLTDLKRQKLRIKDEIVQLERTHRLRSGGSVRLGAVHHFASWMLRRTTPPDDPSFDVFTRRCGRRLSEPSRPSPERSR